jgi:long-chain acyl-CoA synthetase
VSYLAAYDRIEANVKPSKPFVVGATTLTYGDLFDRVRRLTTFLRQRGLPRRERVLLVSRDENEVICLFFALLRNGMTSVIVDPASPAPEIEGLARAAAPVGIVGDADILDGLPVADLIGDDGFALKIRARGGPRHVLSRWLPRGRTNDDSDYHSLIARLPRAERLAHDVSEETLAYIMFTSGTTVAPKGVEITHRNLFANLTTMIRVYGYDAETRVLIQLPLRHTDGLTQGPAMLFLAQGTLYRPGPFSVTQVATIFDWVHKHDLTHFYTVPTALALIDRLCEDPKAAFATPGFRYVVSSAGFLHEKLWRRFEDRFGVMIVNVYGLTETVTGALYCGPDEATRRIGTIGKPIDTEVRVVDAAGADVPQGAVGELLLRGEQITRGYFRNEEATRAALEEGWFRTGDLVRVDEDGFYEMVGRKKLVIMRGGTSVYPERINAVLVAHPDVDDAVTLGDPDETWEERVVSVVLLGTGGRQTPQTLLEHCRARLAPENIPDEIHIVDALPRGPAGKPVLERIREMVRSARSARGGDDRLRQQIYLVAAECFMIAPAELSPASTPEDTPGWNSLAHMQLVGALEERFAVALTPRDIMIMETMGDVERVVRQRLAR